MSAEPSGESQKIAKKRLAATVWEPFRMPLDGHNGQSLVYEPLDHAVSGATDRNQIVSRMVYGLMMSGVYQSALTIELIKEILTAKAAVINLMKLVAVDPLVLFSSGDVLKQVTAEMDIDELESLTDAEHRFAFFDEAGERFQLHDVQNGIHTERAVICLSEECGGDIAAAGKEQMGRPVSGIWVGRSEVGDIHSIQDGFIVLGIRFVTKDGNG